MPVKNIRDLLAGPPHPSEATTLRTLASETVTERTVIPSENAEFTARMPGDGEHPLARLSANPFPGVGVQEVARRVREGEIRDPAIERQARAFVDQFQRLEGQAVYNGRNHEFVEPEIEPTHSVALGSSIGGLQRADRFPHYESSADYVEQVIQANPRARAQAVPQERTALDTSSEEAMLESLWRKS